MCVRMKPFNVRVANWFANLVATVFKVSWGCCGDSISGGPSHPNKESANQYDAKSVITCSETSTIRVRIFETLSLIHI